MKYKVIRTDDHGNTVIVNDDLSAKDARILHDLLEKRGHKQCYEIKEDE